MKAFQKEQNIRLPYWGVAFALMDNQIMLVDVLEFQIEVETFPGELAQMVFSIQVAIRAWLVLVEVHLLPAGDYRSGLHCLS